MELRPAVILIMSLIFCVLYVIISYFGTKSKRLTTADAFLTGGRTGGVIAILAVLVAGQFSGFATVGVPGLSYKLGMAAFYVAVSYAMFSALAFFTMWIPAAELGKKYGYVSCADLFTDRYQSKALGFLWSVIWIVFSVPFMTSQIVAAGTLLEAATNGLFPYWAGVLFMTGVIAIYIFQGGTRGLILVAILQAVLLLIALAGLQIYMIDAVPGGLFGAFQRMAETLPAMISPTGTKGFWTMPMIVSWGLLVGMGSVSLAHLYPRIYAAKDSKTLMIVLGLFCLLIPIAFFHWGTTGPMGRVLFPSLKNPDMLTAKVWGLYTPIWFSGIAVAGALAAMLSTAAGYLLSMAGIFSRDLYKGFINADATPEQELRVSRYGIIIWALVAVIFAFYRTTLVAFLVAMSMSGTITLVAPMFGALWWRRANKYGAIAGPIAGVAIVVYQYSVKLNPISWLGFHPCVWGFVTSTVFFIVVSLLTPEDSKDLQDRFVGVAAKNLSVSRVWFH